MLSITVTTLEKFDEANSLFVEPETYDLELEHSLVSLSKWESVVEKPFLGGTEKTAEETFLYIELMNRTPKIPRGVFRELSSQNYDDINQYVNAKMTATWFAKEESKKKQEVITAEIIYYWMISMNIPFEAQHWHLNQLLTLIRVCNQKNAPPKKLGRRGLAQRNRELNAQRKAQLGTYG